MPQPTDTFGRCEGIAVKAAKAKQVRFNACREEALALLGETVGAFAPIIAEAEQSLKILAQG